MWILGVLAITTCTAAGNVLLKLGVMRPGISDLWPLSMVNLYSFLGTFSFGVAFLGYATLLRRMPLNLAQAIFSIQFVAVIISSALILGESISAARWLGIGLILIGISIVSVTASGEV